MELCFRQSNSNPSPPPPPPPPPVCALLVDIYIYFKGNSKQKYIMDSSNRNLIKKKKNAHSSFSVSVWSHFVKIKWYDSHNNMALSAAIWHSMSLMSWTRLVWVAQVALHYKPTFCGINTNRTTIWSLQMKTFAHFRCFWGWLESLLGVPFNTSFC